MEEFFHYDSPEHFFWVKEEIFPAKNRSAFERYEDRGKGWVAKSINGSMNKRMIEFLRRNWNSLARTTERRERGYQHMINERMRREKQKQSYSALHSLLPPGTKSDKNSIVKLAAKKVEELSAYKEKLERENTEIEAILAARREIKRMIEGAKIRLSVANPSSGIVSMVEVLKYLKKMGATTTSIQSKFSAQELSAVFEIGPEMEAAEVEKAVQKTLFEVERKLHFHF
ncbi:Transcription factor bHLH92 like [Actinidia chinensis var. chinensis]|uniref:Transcription factor bHLH92 like n=1 Tax=Actinidia chinensis var. chinensis TaxID=1590841 RepID=A0A2R6QW41_ACTCC|nr:Transcription factor bHLH92 like [Actinidia chinensis var. chinensis]